MDKKGKAKKQEEITVFLKPEDIAEKMQRQIELRVNPGESEYEVGEISKNIEERLKYFIKGKYKSIRAFSVSSGIPYTTIDNIFKRGVSGLKIKTMYKICNALEIDFNMFMNGEIVPNDYKKINLTEIEDTEKKLLNYYRISDENGKKFILMVAERESNLKQRWLEHLEKGKA